MVSLKKLRAVQALLAVATTAVALNKDSTSSFVSDCSAILLRRAQQNCVVCLEQPADFLCTPCGHQCGCQECLTSVKNGTGKCPICRENIGGLVRVYRSGVEEDNGAPEAVLREEGVAAPPSEPEVAATAASAAAAASAAPAANPAANIVIHGDVHDSVIGRGAINTNLNTEQAAAIQEQVARAHREAAQAQRLAASASSNAGAATTTISSADGVMHIFAAAGGRISIGGAGQVATTVQAPRPAHAPAAVDALTAALRNTSLPANEGDAALNKLEEARTLTAAAMSTWTLDTPISSIFNERSAAPGTTVCAIGQAGEAWDQALDALESANGTRSLRPAVRASFEQAKNELEAFATWVDTVKRATQTRMDQVPFVSYATDVPFVTAVRALEIELLNVLGPLQLRYRRVLRRLRRSRLEAVDV